VNVGVPHVPVSSGLPLKVMKLKAVSEILAPALVLEEAVTTAEVSAIVKLCVEELSWDVVAGVILEEVTDDGGSQTKPVGTVTSIGPVGEVAAASVSTGYMLVHSDDKQYEFTILVAAITSVLLPSHCIETQYST
jgi:hypothetical protein